MTQINTIMTSENILSSVYYNEIENILKNHNCTVDLVTEKNFTVMVRLITPERRVYNELKEAFEHINFGTYRNASISTMKGGKTHRIHLFFIIRNEFSVEFKNEGDTRGKLLLKLLEENSIKTNEDFNIKLAELIYNMSKYTHTKKGPAKKILRSLKKQGVKFLFYRKAFDKITECGSTLGDRLNGFYLGDYNFHLRFPDFYAFYSGCYENEVIKEIELYDGNKRDLSNINTEFKQYIPLFNGLNDGFVDKFLKVNL